MHVHTCVPCTNKKTLLKDLKLEIPDIEYVTGECNVVREISFDNYDHFDHYQQVWVLGYMEYIKTCEKRVVLLINIYCKMYL